MKLWGGRFQKETDRLVEDFHSSIHFDQRLYQEDITGSIAHARMLGKTGIIKEAEAEILIAGLEDILKDIAAGEIEFDISAEDIHMNIETLLTKRVGEVGKKLHTARSRNDQVALDTKMFVRKEIKELLAQIIVLEEGKIVGIGTHQELMQTCEVYQDIAYSQLSKEELAGE